jgi:hypothetical protein
MDHSKNARILVVDQRAMGSKKLLVHAPVTIGQTVMTSVMLISRTSIARKKMQFGSFFLNCQKVMATK